MKLPFQLMALGVVLTVTFGVSTAEAAKGVKKNGQHTVTGWVLNVQHQKGGGMFRVKSAHQHKKVGAANNVAGAVGQQFLVGPGTQFQFVQGARRMPATFAGLHQGERVNVSAQGQQANNVQILSSNRQTSTVHRHRYVGTRHRHVHHVSTARVKIAPQAALPQKAHNAHAKPAVAQHQMIKAHVNHANVHAHAHAHGAAKKR